MEASTGGPEKISEEEILVVLTDGVRVGILGALQKVEAYQMKWNAFGAVLSTLGQVLVLPIENIAKVVVKIENYITLLPSAIKEERTTKALVVTK